MDTDEPGRIQKIVLVMGLLLIVVCTIGVFVAASMIPMGS